MDTLFSFDKTYSEKGFDLIAGIDEAGRGPLAGPVSAAAVIFPKNAFISGLNDSKKISPKKRAELFIEIKKTALAFSIALIDHETIDKINILQATFLAMTKALKGLKIQPDLCLVDGNHKIPKLEIKQEAIIGGDAKSASIAAASILAKVARDEIMVEFSKKFPDYGFEKHKGYGAKQHLEALKEFGICEIHRKTFAPIKNML
ncbi:MAG: ribonuclease HII [Elusimicrobiota bacterium]|nr:ribonuclease HII [Elusimicrobiota bacterium]